MHLFSGKLSAIVEGGADPGSLTFRATANGLRPATLTLPVR